MIFGIEQLYPGQGELFKVLANLNNSQFRFNLTGSRFFGGATTESDYDFYAESTPATEVFLKEIGFVLDDSAGKRHYKNSPFLDKLYVCSGSGTSIHIQLVFPERINLKDRLQEILADSCLCQGLCKHERRKLWQALEKAATGESEEDLLDLSEVISLNG